MTPRLPPIWDALAGWHLDGNPDADPPKPPCPGPLRLLCSCCGAEIYSIRPAEAPTEAKTQGTT